MSVVPANIKIEFISDYLGDHRVCYRLGTSGSYNCITINCSIQGGPCSTNISIFVNNESCENVIYTGYVQAACIPQDSTQDRLAWEYTFVPSPQCKSYLATCALLEIASVQMTKGGTNYTSVPAVSFVGGLGLATGEAVLGLGSISAPSITIQGTGYLDGVYASVPVTCSGCGGTSALVTAVVVGGKVVSIVITNGGKDFITANGLSLNSSFMGPSFPVIDVEFDAVTDLGSVISVININTSQPFKSIPTIIFTGGGGVDAEATVIMEDCPSIVAIGCSGSDVTIPAGSLNGFGDTIILCSFSEPSLDESYVASLTGNCLCNCVTATIGITGSLGDQVRYFYNKCGLEVRTGLLTVGGSPSQIIDCIVPGSLVFQVIDDGAAGTVTYGADCP